MQHKRGKFCHSFFNKWSSSPPPYTFTDVLHHNYIFMLSTTTDIVVPPIPIDLPAGLTAWKHLSGVHIPLVHYEPWGDLA